MTFTLNQWLAPSVGLGGLVVFAIGASALIGRLAKYQGLYLWIENDPGMAINTAIGFVIIGLCLMASGLWMHRHTGLQETSKTEPLDVLSVALLLSCAILMLAGVAFKQATIFTASSYILLSAIGLLYKRRWRRNIR
jgi:hypothetical protein